MTKKTYTLTQLADSVKNVISKAYGENCYWVSCELVKANIKGGHYYLELADTQEGINTAQMRAVIWRTQVLALQTNLGEEFKQLVQAGNRILVSVSVTFHEIYGFSLTIHDLDPTYTYGEIELKKKQTIERLQQEGLLDLQKRLQLPIIVKRIVLVGSPDTSGYRDFLTEMLSNSIFRNFAIKEIATTVQGDKAVAEICAALLEADTYDADAVVLIRGGGSKMDLNVFNDYQICKTIAQMQLPVLTGIGHENDEVVADMVAHIKQITPTAVAKFLYVRVGTFRADLQTNLDRILTLSMTHLAAATERFTNTNQLLTLYFQHLISEQRALLELSLNRGITSAMHHVQVLRDLELPAILERMLLSAQNQMELEALQLKGFQEKLDLLNPLKLLRVGYTLSSIENIDLAHYQGELIGKELKTRTDRLTVWSTITKIQSEA